MIYSVKTIYNYGVNWLLRLPPGTESLQLLSKPRSDHDDDGRGRREVNSRVNYTFYTWLYMPNI